MRYTASEKLEIIGIVERSHLSVRRTLEQIGIPRASFYRWYDLYQTGGPDALEDRSPKPGRVWNRIPDDVRGRVLQLALDELERSQRELAVHSTDTKALRGEPVGLYQIDDNAWHLKYGPILLGTLKGRDQWRRA